ncbi:hypothetical protein ACRRTK_003342 [Alexandromys fortis]
MVVMKRRSSQRKPATSYVRTTINEGTGHPQQHQARDSKEQVLPGSAYGSRLQGQGHPTKTEVCGCEKEMDLSHQDLLSPIPQKS